MATASEQQLGWVRFSCKGVNEIAVRCNAFAAHREPFSDDQLKVVAFAGPSSTVKAAIAMLYSKSACVVTASKVPGFSAHFKAVKSRETKWHVHKTPLGDPRYRLWHAIAWDKSDDRLMLDYSEDSLWAVLRSDKFTTPILRSWVPAIRKHLLDQRKLQPLTAWGCSPGIFVASDKTLDDVVCGGVLSGELEIGMPDRAAA